MELMVASLLGIFIILAVGKLDVSRLFMAQEVDRSAAFQMTMQQTMGRITQQLRSADRIFLLSSGDPSIWPVPVPSLPATVQIRTPSPTTDNPPTCLVGSCTGPVPQPCCFAMAQNYRWVQIDHRDTNGDTIPDAIALFDNYNPATGVMNCATVKILARNVGTLTLQFLDTFAAPALGGEPFPGTTLDNNVLGIQLNGIDPLTGQTRTASTEVELRAVPLTQLGSSCSAAGPCDSGEGMASSGVSNPPNVCP